MVKWPIISIMTCSLALNAVIFPLQAQEKISPETIVPEKTILGPSGYLIPRYVSLAKNTVNVRTGPNGDYPIIWVFKKAGLPVKVIAEYKDWRKIVDSEGARGWVWGPLVSSKRNALIIADQQALLKGPAMGQPVSVIAEAGVIGKIKICQAGWCEIDVNGFKGWLRQSVFWGTLNGEILK